MLLNNKNAVIYGAGGSLGGAVAKSLAAAGATVFLTGRTTDSLQRCANDIIHAGGKASIALVDAMNEKAISEHLDNVLKQAGSIDISFNAVATRVVQNIPMVDMPADDYMQPVTDMLRTRFLTAVAACKRMIKQQSGVILSLTATPGGIGYPYTAGFAAACTAIETFASNLAAEVGIYGVRVVNIRSGGSPDSTVFKSAIDKDPAGMAPILRSMEADTMLKKLPLMADIANVAVFLASDMAAKITGVTIDVTAGTTSGLNYRVSSTGKGPGKPGDIIS